MQSIQIMTKQPRHLHRRASSVSGRISRHNLNSSPQHQYYLFVPSWGSEGAPVLAAVHGISRNAKQQVKAFADLAERHGMVVLAPLFAAKTAPAYQRLGVTEGRQCTRPDLVLEAMLQETSDTTGARTDQVYLFGYSGGGQFAHRYAMVKPHRVLAVAMGAPGWFTFPDGARPYPHGLQVEMAEPALTLRPRDFLRVPMAVFVGEDDDQRDPALNSSRSIDKQQGYTRLERAYRWTRAMESAAEDYGYSTHYHHQILHRCGHSFVDCIQRGGMGENVFDFLLQAKTDSFANTKPGAQIFRMV